MSNGNTQSLESLVFNVTEKTAGLKDATKPYVGLEHIPSGGGLLIGFGSAADSISTNNVFRKGDTLFGKLRPQLHKSVRAAFDGYCSTDILVLRPLAGVCGEFAAKVVQSETVFAQAIRTEEGTKMPRTSWEAIRCVQLFAPHDEAEQRKIARILTTLDNLIEKTESLIAKYQAIKQGMMHDLFTRGVDAHGHLRPPQAEASDLYKQSELGWIPKEWEACRLEELYASPIRDFGSFSSTNLITFLESGIPFIKSEMIEAGNINWVGVTYISDHVHQLLNKSHVREGDILFSKIGSALGKGVVYDGSRGVCNSNAAVAKIDIDQRVAGRHFIAHFLNHDIAKIQLRNMIVSLLPRINLGDLSRLLVPCPTIAEQHLIEERLLSSDTAIKTEESSLRQLLSIKTGLMQDLLTGKVRVKVDEAEEVAP